MAERQAISNDNRIVELLELLAKNQMDAQAEQVKQMCGDTGTADRLQKQCDSLKQQVTELKGKICDKTGKLVDE